MASLRIFVWGVAFLGLWGSCETEKKGEPSSSPSTDLSAPDSNSDPGASGDQTSGPGNVATPDPSTDPGMGSAGTQSDPEPMAGAGSSSTGAQLQVEDDVRYFSNTLYPVLAQNCQNCHAQMVSPLFAVPSAAEARQTVVNTGVVNFSFPEGSRFVLRLQEDRHNCWGECQENADEMLGAIREWIRLRGDQSGSYFESQSLRISDAVARVAQTERGSIVLEAENGEANFRIITEQDPTASGTQRAVSHGPPDHPEGRSEGNCGDQPYRFTGPDGVLMEDPRGPGVIRFQINVRTEGNYALWVRIQAQGFVDWNAHLKDSSGQVLPTYYDYDRDQQQSGCLRFTSRSNDWIWKVPGNDYQGEFYQRKWRLAPGIYTLELFERWPRARLDVVALSRMDEFNPKNVPFDASFISDYRPRELSYDISAAVGDQAQFTIEVREGSENSYILSNPRIISSNKRVRVQFIQPVLNGITHDNDAAFSIIDKVTDTDAQILRRQSMVILKDKGADQDFLSFRFGILAASEDPATRPDDDAPAPVETRECLALDLFNNKVKPIFKAVQMVRQEDYNTFVERFPGSGDQIAASPTLYRCTGCHGADHQLFPMNASDDAVLCQQGLSRADFVNPERSVLTRGINGSYGHPSLYPLQDLVATNDGYEIIMYQNQPLMDGDVPAYRSVWKGRFAKYAAGDAVMSEAGRTEDEIRAIRRNIGALKRIQFQYTMNGAGATVPLKNGDDFVYSVLAPYDPGFGDGRLEVAASGDETFEATRANWRNVIINWIREEKRLFDEQMNQ